MRDDFLERVADPSQKHPVDTIEPEIDHDPDDLRALGGHNPETLAVLMRVLLVPDFNRGFQPQVMLVRLIVLAHALHIEPIGGMSLASLAERIGVSRALLANYACKVRDFANLDCRAGKTVSARERLVASHLWHIGGGKGKKRPKKPEKWRQEG